MSNGSPTFKSNPNPGKLNTSMWETGAAFGKKDNGNELKAKLGNIPKKVSLYGKSFYDDKDTDNNEPQEKPKEVIIGGDDNAEELNTDGMIQIRGKCITSGCKCDKYVENPSKWSKGKCKACPHTEANHKQIWVKKENVEQNGSSPSKPMEKPIKPKEQQPPQQQEAKVPEEELENIWGEEFTDKLKECVSCNFDYDGEAILPAKYLLHYLKKRIQFDFTGQTKHRDALKYVCVQLFEWKVINPYGYNIKVLYK